MRGTAVACFGAALVVGATSAQAIQIIQVQPLSVVAATTDILGFQEFDPTLGTLDRVSVTIAGTLQVSGVLPGFASLVPIVDLDVQRAGSRGFAFGSPQARFVLAGATNPSDGPLPFDRAAIFEIAMRFDAASDLVGFDVPTVDTSSGALTPPGNATAMRSSFIEGLAPLGISETLVFSPAFGPAAGGVLVVSGSVEIAYDYTPTQPVAVPAPAVSGLLVGAAILFARRRARG